VSASAKNKAARTSANAASVLPAAKDQALIGSTSGPEHDPFRLAVLPMALAVVLFVILSAYFADRIGGSDELGLYNPTYMDVHYGKMTYPIYGFYDSMPVHPPIHYKAIAAFMRAGLTLYYAQATPTALWLLLCIGLVVSSRLSSSVKIGFLFGICMSYAFLFETGAELFGMRPEGELGAAWLAGLLALETGRQNEWNLPRIFLGALLLTYAASLHFYAAIAVLGAVVYGACAVVELKWPRAKRVIKIIAVGCVLYGLADLILWVIPQRADILYMLRSVGTNPGIAAIVREHMALYHYWASLSMGTPWLRLPFTIGLPVVLISTPLLLAMRGTRILSLAALPIQLFLLLFASHKHGYYFIHEIALYGAAVVAAALTALNLAVRKLPSAFARNAIGFAAIGFLLFSLWGLSQFPKGLNLAAQPRVHGQEVARAAAREILGPNARVASRLTTWYASGAADLYDPSRTLLWPSKVTPEGAASYLSRFDAIAEAGHMSNSTSNSDHKALLSWYVDGTLQLRGFFFAEADNSLSYLLLRVGSSKPLRGYGLKNGQLYSFTESAGGDHEFVAIVGASDTVARCLPQRVLFKNIMLLPAAGAGQSQSLLTAVIQANGAQPEGAIPPDCRVVDKVRLAITVADKDALVAKLRTEDRPIRFHQSGVPAPGDSLGGAKDMPKIGRVAPLGSQGTS